MKNIQNIHQQHRVAQLLFIVLPTIAVAGFFLWQANSFFSILRNQWVAQFIYFGVGLIIGNLIFSGRLRFITSFAALVLAFYFIYRYIDNFALGEFDAFFLSKQFLVFAILFCFGILLGWGLQRYSSFSIIVASFFFLLAIYLLSKTGEFTMQKIIFVLLPIILYCIYLIFTSNELAKFKETRQFSWSSLLKRLVLFLGLLIVIGGTVIYFMKTEIKDVIAEYGGESNDDNSMLKKNKDGTLENQNNMGLAKNNRRSNELVFCAYINNFFEGTEYPNPLYLTSFYFTKFDTLTETFERDPSMPFNDEFTPDPNAIPLFSRNTKKSVLDSALTTKFITEVEIEVYKKKLSKDAFVAPSTAYEVQPITVEKDFQDDYLYAYRAKSAVSKLNSAYFIYNTDDPMIATFQEQRFDELRKAKDYSNTPKRFYDYYTFFPSSYKYENFKTLADSLEQTANTTIDKILTIRDYFKQKNPLGEDVYSYSDNPGIPGLPGASKLSTFMFETKKGWCTYYAGSSLLLLRAMNIPSRIAVGFMTVDRSDNNKGWYWFYQDQAHAWIQVYFPEYGWLDFDFTIGNDEAQQSPQPDQTPPMQPPKAVVVASGEIKNVDTTNERLLVQANHFIYKEKEFRSLNELVNIDATQAKIWRDSSQINIAQLQPTDYVVSVSYDVNLGKINATTIKPLLEKLPRPIPIDEIYLKTQTVNENTLNKNEKREQTIIPFYMKIILPLIITILFLVSFPFLLLKIYALRFRRAKTPEQRAYRLFRYTTYYLNQMGYAQQKNSIGTERLTLNEYARTIVEPVFQNNYTQFTTLYQKIKFSTKPPTPDDDTFLRNYFSTFTQNIRQKIKPSKRLKYFLKLNRTLNYLISYQNND